MEPIALAVLGWMAVVFAWAIDAKTSKRQIREQAEEISKLKAQIAYYRRELLRNRSKREADRITAGSITADRIFVGHPALTVPDPDTDQHRAFEEPAHEQRT